MCQLVRYLYVLCVLYICFILIAAVVCQLVRPSFEKLMMKWFSAFCRTETYRVLLWSSLASYYACINKFYILYPQYNFTYVYPHQHTPVTFSVYSLQTLLLLLQFVEKFLSLQLVATSVGTGASTFNVFCKRPIQISSRTPNILNNVFVIFLSVFKIFRG